MANFETYNPKLICIQYDPMKYLSNMRQFSVECGPFIKEWAQKNELGIFGQENYEDMMEDLQDQIADIGTEKISEKTVERIKMMMFPVTWREARVDRSSLMLCDFYLNKMKS